MHLNLHGYNYKEKDVAWILDGTTPRKGIIQNIAGNTYSILMDDTQNTENFTSPLLFPLKSHAEIHVDQFLITPTPSISHSITPTPTRTPRAITPTPTPSSSYVNRPNGLSTATTTWSASNSVGTANILSGNKLKLEITKDVSSGGGISQALSLQPGDILNLANGTSFMSSSITTIPNSDYEISIDLEQGSCRFVAVIVFGILGTSADLLVTQYYHDSSKFSFTFDSGSYSSIGLIVKLFDDPNFRHNAKKGATYTLNNMNFRYIGSHVIAKTVTPTPSKGFDNTNYSKLVMAKNPLAYWSFDENNKLNDLITHNSLTLNGASLVPDAYGNVLNIQSNGVQSIAGPTPSALGATLANTINLTNDFTVEAWVKFDNLGSGNAVFGTTVGSLYLYENSGIVYADYSSDNDWIQGDATLFSPNDYHIVMVVDATSKGSIYVNGVLHGSDQITDPFVLKYIGNDPYGESFAGNIGNVAIYGKALTLAEIQENYNAGTTGYRYSSTIVTPVSLPMGAARLNSDGSVDTSFNTIKPNSYVNNIIEDANKAILVGQFTAFNGDDRYGFVKLNSDGSVNSFAENLSSTTNFRSVIQTSDQKIYVSGGFYPSKIWRLNSDSTIDTSYTPIELPNGDIYEMHQTIDGKIYVVGSMTNPDNTINSIVRLNSDGTYDATYSGISITDRITNIYQAVDGKIYIAGWFTSIAGNSYNHIARLNSDGTLDTSFVDLNRAMTVYGITQTSDGKIYIYGQDFIRLNSDGTIDNTYTLSVGSSDVYSMLETSDGKIYIGGSFSTITTGQSYTYNDLARLNSDGSLDTTFVGFDFDQNVQYAFDQVSSLIESGGKIYVIGYFDLINGSVYRRIFRLNSDGTLDGTYTSPQIAYQPSVTSGFIGFKVADGMFITGFNANADLNRVNGDDYMRIAVLTNGVLDTTVNKVAIDGEVTSIAKTSDGKIYISGNFNYIDGYSYSSFARLNSDFTLDTTYTKPTEFNTSSTFILKLDDDSMYSCSRYVYSNGYIFTLYRLAGDGTIDSTYTPITTDNTITKMIKTIDGKFYIIGTFNNVNGTAYPKIARLNSDGTLDTSFVNPALPISSYGGIGDIVQTPDGSIYVVGPINSYSANTNGCIARFNSDGTLDTTFAGISKIKDQPRSLCATINNQVYVGVNNGVLRINSNGTDDASFNRVLTSVQNGISTIPSNPKSMYQTSDGKIIVC